MSKEPIEIASYDEWGYRPLFASDNVRVAMLNYHPELLPDQINNLQKHNLSDETFVLLAGHCVLFVEDTKSPFVQAIPMEPGKAYRIPKGVYHTHSLSKDGKVLVVERDDTCDENSPVVAPTPQQTEYLIKACAQYLPTVNE